MPYQYVGNSDTPGPTPALSIEGIQWYLAEAVNADSREFTFRARLRIEDEIILVIKSDVVGGSTDVAGPVLEVLRGQEGTAAVAHAAGAEYEWLGPPG
jgi:hypothetical protein